jgi:hypothetical protein
MANDKPNPIQLAADICSEVVSPELAESMRQFTAMIQETQKHMEKYAPIFQGMASEINKHREMLAPILEQFEQLLEHSQPVIEFIRRIPEALQYTREADLTLARNGWYIDPEIPADEPFELAKQFEAGNSTQANEALSNRYDSCLDEIEKSLCDSFPERARLLHNAFGAHRRKEFCLSIPVFLAQADGICFNNTKAPLYSKPKMQKALNHILDDGFLACLLAPLVDLTPIADDTRKTPVIPDALNRHTIMHGLSVDYDTRVNSCRAISLLVFVAWVLKHPSIKARIAKPTQNKPGRNKRN